jgi:DNA-binding phage protein
MNERERKQQIINLAIEEYLNTPETERSLTKLGEKYGVKRQTLSKHLKNRGYEVINY